MNKNYELYIEVSLSIGNSLQDVHYPVTIPAINSMQAINKAIEKYGLHENDEYNYEALQEILFNYKLQDTIGSYVIHHVGISAPREIN